MPGSLTSMPNSAVPLTLAGVSRRFVRLPTMREVLRVLQRRPSRAPAASMRLRPAGRRSPRCRRAEHHAVLRPAASRDRRSIARRRPMISISRTCAPADAQLFPAVAHRGRAAGELRAAEQRVAVELGVGRRDRDLDAAQVDVEFLGDQHRHRGVDALPHLGAGRDQRDGVVVGDVHPGIRRVQRAGGVRTRRSSAGQRRRRASGRRRRRPSSAGRRGATATGRRSANGGAERCVHGRAPQALPHSAAAVLMAALMRP